MCIRDSANSFLDTGVIPACVEILEPRSSLATMLTKFFISAAQLLLPFMLGALAGASLSYNVLLYISGIAILVIGVLVIFAPMPKAEKAAGEKAPGLLENIRNSHFSAESIALIVIGFTCTRNSCTRSCLPRAGRVSRCALSRFSPARG